MNTENSQDAAKSETKPVWHAPEVTSFDTKEAAAGGGGANDGVTFS